MKVLSKVNVAIILKMSLYSPLVKQMLLATHRWGKSELESNLQKTLSPWSGFLRPHTLGKIKRGSEGAQNFIILKLYVSAI